MATMHDEPPTLRCDSPSPDSSPTPAMGSRRALSRCLSAASTLSDGSATTDASNMRESLGSDISAASRESSGSYLSSRRSDASLRSRASMGGFDKSTAKRRGYMRPHGTDFAASARSRESVLSLGSIAHLQYYFARTGLLDGKGAQLARKRQGKAATLDLSALEASSYLAPNAGPSEAGSSYASTASSPDLRPHGFGGNGTTLGAGAPLVESPIQEENSGFEGYGWDDYEPPDPNMLPPTTSTYNHREKPVPRPPTIEELKAELKAALDAASTSLNEARAKRPPSAPESDQPPPAPESPAGKALQGWYEVQGMHILDVMTLAIRAAKMYYTGHEHPDRLDAIKPEREVRAELLSVMDVLKRMATRLFGGGLRDDELRTMDAWIVALYHMLAQEEEMEAAERAERARWTWLRDADWAGGGGFAREVEREYAFIQSLLDPGSSPTTTPTTGTFPEPLPHWAPIDRARPLEAQELPTPFLQHMQNGVQLVQLHNCAVRKSQRRFGAIPTFHTDTQKPYRSADNLRYWIKAAELRWEVLLKADALGIVYSSGPQVWLDFEDAILKWCRKVREEIAGELDE